MNIIFNRFEVSPDYDQRWAMMMIPGRRSGWGGGGVARESVRVSGSPPAAHNAQNTPNATHTAHQCATEIRCTQCPNTLLNTLSKYTLPKTFQLILQNIKKYAVYFAQNTRKTDICLIPHDTQLWSASFTFNFCSSLRNFTPPPVVTNINILINKKDVSQNTLPLSCHDLRCFAAKLEV